MADNMVARSFDPAAVSSSTPEVAHAAPEAVQLTTIAQSSNISQASVIPNIDRIVQEQPQEILGFSKVSRQIDNVTPSETSRGFQNNSGANATRISHGDNTLTSHLSRSVTVYNGPPIMRRNLASRGADIARADSNKRKSFELSGSLLETTLQRTHQESPIAPLITSDPKSGFSGGGSSAISESVPSPNQEPVHSLIAHSAKETHELKPHNSYNHDLSHAKPSVPSNTELKAQNNNQLDLTAQFGPEISAHASHINSDPSSLPTVARVLVSRKQEHDQPPLIMRQPVTAITSPHQVLTQSPSSQKPAEDNFSDGQISTGAGHSTLGSLAKSSSSQEPTADNLPATQTTTTARDTVHENLEPHQMTNTPVYTSENTTQLAADVPIHDRTVVRETTSTSPGAPILHLKNETTDNPPTGLSSPSAPDNHEPTHSSAVPYANNGPAISTVSSTRPVQSTVFENQTKNSPASILHLKRDSISSDILNLLEKHPINSDAPQKLTPAVPHNESPSTGTPVDRSSIHSEPQVQRTRHFLETSAPGLRPEGSKLKGALTPTVNSLPPILRSASSSPSATGLRFSNDTDGPVVVQESILEKTSPAEPSSLSHYLSRAIFRDPSLSSHETKNAINMSATTASGASHSLFTHRSPLIAAGVSVARSVSSLHLASLPAVERQTTTVGGSLSNVQLPALSAATNIPNTPAFGSPSLDITQLANRVYEVLVRRLASERQRRGR